MTKDIWRNFIASILVASLGFSVGYFCADNSVELNRLRAELQEARASAGRNRSSGRPRFTMGGTSTGPVPANALLMDTNTGPRLSNDLLVSEQLQGHMAKIHQASLEAEEAIAQVLDARSQYDQRVRVLLSEGDYTRYRQYEASKPAQRELENIQKYLSTEKRVAIEAGYAQTLARAIQEANAADNEQWHGPYDSLPQVRVGRDQVLDWAQRRVLQASESGNRVLEQMAAAGCPEEQLKYLGEYFATRLQD